MLGWVSEKLCLFEFGDSMFELELWEANLELGFKVIISVELLGPCVLRSRLVHRRIFVCRSRIH